MVVKEIVTSASMHKIQERTTLDTVGVIGGGIEFIMSVMLVKKNYRQKSKSIVELHMRTGNIHQCFLFFSHYEIYTTLKLPIHIAILLCSLLWNYF